MPKKVLIALPSGLLEETDRIAHAEHRTRSDLIREALRRYSTDFRRNNGSPVVLAPPPGPAKVTSVALIPENGDQRWVYTNPTVPAIG